MLKTTNLVGLLSIIATKFKNPYYREDMLSNPHSKTNTWIICVICFVCALSLGACQNINVAESEQGFKQEIKDSIDKNWVVQQHHSKSDTCHGLPSLDNKDVSDLTALPLLAHHVNDSTGLLNLEEASKLDQYLYDYEQKTGAQFVVFIVPSLGGEGVFSYSQRIACKYHFGRKQIGDGIFLVIARQEQKFYLYVMKQVSPFVSDEKAEQIASEILTPAFKKQQFYEGITRAMSSAMSLVDGKFPLPSKGFTAN